MDFLTSPQAPTIETTASLSEAGGDLLEVARDIRIDGTERYALSRQPWFRFRSTHAFAPGALVELHYAASFFDDPVRPVLRFRMANDEHQDHLLPAPCEGTAIWIGRVPEGRAQIWISPTNRLGRFDFDVLTVGPASIGTLIGKTLRSPRRMFYAIAARLVSLRKEADLNLRYALGGETSSSYRLWRSSRRRSPDYAAIDTPRSDWAAGPKISLIVRARKAAACEIDATCRSIAEQSYPNWRVLFADDERQDDAGAARLSPWLERPRYERLSAASVDFDAMGNEWIGVLNAGDRLAAHALACFVEYFARYEGRSIVYADVVRTGPRGELEPEFKPGWSPLLQQGAPYIGRAALFRPALLADASRLGTDEPLGKIIADSAGVEVGCLRRPLFYFPFEKSRNMATQVATPSAFVYDRESRVAIIVPTRDRADLLEPCLETLLNRSSYRRMTVLVVDNDSVEPRTHRLLTRLRAADPRLETLRSPGPFNFSALCNQGARAADGDHLVFLNNDTTVISPDWIEELLSFAERPDIGAVGTKLLYPNGAVQHVGVVLGMGGVAGHFGADLSEDAPGWSGRNQVPHEVSAVTGACLMVERTKFEAVGGFDEINLPVELNDVDLCLRLAERGWKTICNPRAKLTHHQSASRGGASFRLQRVYEKERAYFYDRWMDRIRDDPYFHPGLSLYERVPALA